MCATSQILLLHKCFSSSNKNASLTVLPLYDSQGSGQRSSFSIVCCVMVYWSWRCVSMFQCSKQVRSFYEIKIFNIISVWFFFVHEFLWLPNRNRIYLRVLNGCKFSQLKRSDVGESSHTFDVLTNLLLSATVHSALHFSYCGLQYWHAYLECESDHFNSITAFMVFDCKHRFIILGLAFIWYGIEHDF